jgi:hypothetical protein
MRQLRFLVLLLSINTQIAKSLRVAVFGGSGFVGRRVCQTLVGAGCEVISISRSGKPPSYYCDPVLSQKVQWMSYNVDCKHDNEYEPLILPPIDAAVSCVGNVQPCQKWMQLFGLGFNDEQLSYENGELNERICEIAKEAGASIFVFLSVSYEVAKCLEGPIAGYLDGKRRAENAAYKLFGANNTVVLGASLIYGGKRFPKLGRFYRSFVESSIAKAYVGGNDFLRSLSTASPEDWVEKMVFSSPIQVEPVARLISGGALGLITRKMVGPRKQGFFDTDGKPVVYGDVLFIDGTQAIERLDKLINLPVTESEEVAKFAAVQVSTASFISSPEEEKEPPFEGALIGKSLFLRPLPTIFTFSAIFWSVATQQFFKVVENTQ